MLSIVLSLFEGSTVSESIIIQQPAHATQQLMVLHHGVGASAEHMVSLGRRLATHYPNAFVVSVQAPYSSDNGAAGFQWFSVQGITEENRSTRVADAMPVFIRTVAHWQQQSGVTAGATALIGFSQGAIMALEAAQAQAGLAARIVALSGRYASLPTHAPEKTTLHFIHGKSDPVIHYGHCVAAAERLVDLGGDVTADVIPFLSHEINTEVMDLLVERFSGHIPKHQWDEVRRAAQQSSL
jgi:phospholipase/carboxylesterase